MPSHQEAWCDLCDIFDDDSAVDTDCELCGEAMLRVDVEPCSNADCDDDTHHFAKDAHVKEALL